MYSNEFTIHDRLEEILESIELIQGWSEGKNTADDYMLSSNGIMAFNACVMRIQVIGEQVGKLLKVEQHPLKEYPQIPWLAIYDMRNIISHEYANIDEDLVVSVINNDLPELKKVITNLLQQY